MMDEHQKQSAQANAQKEHARQRILGGNLFKAAADERSEQRKKASTYDQNSRQLARPRRKRQLFRMFMIRMRVHTNYFGCGGCAGAFVAGAAGVAGIARMSSARTSPGTSSSVA